MKKKKKFYKGKIPYRTETHWDTKETYEELCHYAYSDPGEGDDSNWRKEKWRDNEPFQATLILEGHVRGRSAAYFMFRDLLHGTRYPMFMTSLVDLLKREDDTAHSMGASFVGWWIAEKRGANFGIKYLGYRSTGDWC